MRSSREGKIIGPPLVGVGAAAVDFQVGTGRMPMAQPGAQAPRKPPVYTEDEIAALAAYVASLGPGPAIPDEADYSIEGLSDEEREEAIVRGGQIFLTNCTACHNFEGSGGAMPRGGYAPRIRGVEPKYIYEAMLTGPQEMPTFSNGNLSPEEKRDVIAYLDVAGGPPDYGGFGLGGLGPVSEGLCAWVLGIGACVGFAVWIAAHTTRTEPREGRSVSAPRRPRSRRCRESRRASPIANPGLPAHQWRPTDVDPKAEKRAERQVATLFGVATHRPARSSSPTSSSTSATTRTPSPASAPPT